MTKSTRAAHTSVRALGMALCAALTAALAAGCGGPARTVANFCTHYTNDKAHYLQKYDAEGQSISKESGSNPLAGLLGATGMSAQMLGSIDDMFTDLAKVAPSDIQTQVEQIRDSLKKQENLVGSGRSLLGILGGSLLSSLETSDDWQAVGTYVQRNCHTT